MEGLGASNAVIALRYAGLTQLVEYLPYKKEATGSSPVSRTNSLVTHDAGANPDAPS